MAVEIRFGKHKGKTLEWIFWNDPGYVYWMVEKNIHQDANKFRHHERQRIQDLLRKAAHLRIPGTCIYCKAGKPNSRMIMVQHTSGGLTSIDFDCDTCHPPGGGWTAMTPSFYTPDIFRKYDKTGGKFLVQSLKYAYFGSSSYRMTKKRIEDFWDNDANFVNP